MRWNSSLKKKNIKNNFYSKKKTWEKATNKKFSHKKNKLGYRSDCSGFISYMWDVDSKYGNGGARTRYKGKDNLINWGKKINKNNLKKGDVILVPNNHVVMFDKWLDKNKTKYYGHEMCNVPSCRGFMYNKLDYPYTKSVRPNFKNVILLRKNKENVIKY